MINADEVKKWKLSNVIFAESHFIAMAVRYAQIV